MIKYLDDAIGAVRLSIHKAPGGRAPGDVMSMNIPGYTVLREIAQGGMGVVYLAIQKALDRQVALKVLPAAPARNPSFRKAFLDEGKVVARLNHPHIITLYDLGHTSGAYYISMEYVPGKNLKERIQDGLLLKDTLKIIVQLAKALGYAHGHGVVHRDIKPTNVLFRDDRFPVLTDFGVAKLHDEGILLHSDDALIATPSYVPPERVKGEPEDARSDLYSLGALFHEMLLGFPPYMGGDAQATALNHVHEPIPRVPEKIRFLQPILDRLLAKDPAERFGDTHEFIRSLEDVVHSCVADAADLWQELEDHATLVAPVSPVVDKTQDSASRSRRLLGRMSWIGAGAAAVILWHYVLAPRFFFSLDPQAEYVLQQLLAYEGTRPVESLLGELEAESPYATYSFAHAVLQGHPRVIESLRQLAGRFEARARQEWQRGHLDQALLFVRQGLHFHPQHDSLLHLERFMRQERRVQKLLAKAKQHVEEARLSEPQGNNAFDTYNAVLLLDRNNREAREGLRRIAQRLTENAQIARHTGDLQQSLAFIDQGLRVRPQANELHALKDTVAQDQRKLGEKHRRLVAQWLDRARAQLQSGRLTTPAGDNAFETYRIVLVVVPGQTDALAGLEQIAEQSLRLAEAAQRPGNMKVSLAHVDRGLQAVPDHARLMELRAMFRGGETEVIQRLFNKAERQFVASHLTAPKGNNALETYKAILDLDPHNAKGRDGLKAIAKHYNALAEDRQRTDDLNAALSFVEEGLKAEPKDGGLLAQKKVIQRKLTAQQAARSPEVLRP